jgi:hypothetical protein
MLHQTSFLAFDRSSVLRVVSIKSDPLGPSGFSLVKFNLLLDWSSMNNLVDEAGLRFYQDIWPIESHCKANGVD